MDFYTLELAISYLSTNSAFVFTQHQTGKMSLLPVPH